MRDAGLQATVHPTPGHPVVVGEWRGAGNDAPTVLAYGHYDVQPAEPLELWESAAVRANDSRSEGSTHADRSTIKDSSSFT